MEMETGRMTDIGHNRPLALKTGQIDQAPPVVSIVGNSGSVKTTFIEKLIPELTRAGLKVGTVKHDVHGFEMDKPGKDSWRHKKAGAATSMIASPKQIGIVMDVDYDHSPDELVVLFSGMDIVLAEGYKRGNKPKLEIFRPEVEAKPLCLEDPHLIAMITDTEVGTTTPTFATSDARGVATFLIDHFKLEKSAGRRQ